jgi:putative radical SAM enzyme (TIGR03279 family)
MEITAGDILLSINGLPVTDILDYRYLIADDCLEVEIEKADGEIWLLDIEKEYEDDLGVIFPEAMIGTKTCKNNCIFCFIDQLPAGMRESLYVKDDDERLSFLTGNYITMTNLTPDELNRIIRYRIMPMNLSIHTTNPDLRIKMLKNRFAGDVMSYLESFYDNGIVMNGQIVLVPDFNDGPELAKTLSDLKAFYPLLQSLSVVPVGLSRHRQGLESLRLFTQDDALKTLEMINAVHDEMAAKHGEGFVYPSDEFFLLAGLAIPDSDYYSGFPQIENGVGMMADFKASVTESLARRKTSAAMSPVETTNKRIGLLTGRAAEPFLSNLLAEIKQHYPLLDLSLFPITNHFFGEAITVSGLLTGCDILAQVKPQLEKNPIDLLLLPENALRSDTDTLLDDWTLETLGQALNVTIAGIAVAGEALLQALLEA